MRWPVLSEKIPRGQGAVQTQGFLVLVTEVRAESPVASKADLSEKILKPYSKTIAFRNRYEILESDCSHDERTSRVWALCSAEARDYQIVGIDASEANTYSLHG